MCYVEALGEERVVEVAHHQCHQAGAHAQQFGVRRMDLVAPQRVRRGQRGGVERSDDELMVGLVVHHPGADQPLMGGGQDAVVQGLLQGEGLGVVRP